MVKQLRPPHRLVVPLWDLNLVLSALAQAPFGQMGSATLKDLKLKVVFQVAICSALRISKFIGTLALGTLSDSLQGQGYTTHCFCIFAQSVF